MQSQGLQREWDTPHPPPLNPTFLMVKNKFHFICLTIPSLTETTLTLHIVKYFMGVIVTSQKALQCFDFPVSIQLILEGFI